MLEMEIEYSYNNQNNLHNKHNKDVDHRIYLNYN